MTIAVAPLPSRLIRSWEAFDRLFEEAFAPSRHLSYPASPQQVDQRRQTRSGINFPTTPTAAAPAAVPTPAQAPPAVSPAPRVQPRDDLMSDQDEDFKQLWEEASRRRKVTRTVTRKRTLTQGTMPNTPSVAATNPLSPGAENRVSRRRSKFHVSQTPESNVVTATFELPDVRKEDVHVAFQVDRLTITYFSVVTTEKREAERTLLRERKERKYARTLPLPAGTSFEDISAFLEDGRLTVTYPKNPRVPLVPIRPTS